MVTDSPGTSTYHQFYETYDPNAVIERPAIKLGLYARISEANDTNGVDRQIRTGQRTIPDHPWLKGRPWEIVDSYVDNDISAHDVRLDRPEFLRLLADLRSGRINAIWCSDYDRLARQELDAAMIKRDMEMFGGELVLTDRPGENYDAVTGEGRQMWQIRTVFADNEVRQTKVRQKNQRRDKVEKGKFNGGKRRFGYNKNMSEVIPQEADVIKEVSRRMLAGESVCSLAKELNARGIPTALGGRWVATNLQRCVTGPHVAGFRLAYGGIAPTRAVWSPILDEDTWHRLQVLINDPIRKRGLRKGKPKRVSPLTGLLWCGRCGRILRTQKLVRNGNETRYWQCNSPDGCRGLNRSDRKYSFWIETEVLAAYDDADFVRRLLVVDDDGTSHQDLFDRKRGAEQLLNELDADFYDPPQGQRRMDRQLWEKVRSNHLQTIAECDGKLRSLTAKQNVDVDLVSSGRLKELWPGLSIDDKHSVIKFAVRKVVVAPSPGVSARSERPEDHYKIIWADSPER